MRRELPKPLPADASPRDPERVRITIEAPLVVETMTVHVTTESAEQLSATRVQIPLNSVLTAGQRS